LVERGFSRVDLLLVAYDGLQFYRMYHCALTAPQGSIDEAMLEKSAARLDSRVVKHRVNMQVPEAGNLRDQVSEDRFGPNAHAEDWLNRPCF
jgi:hypothetical protein